MTDGISDAGIALVGYVTSEHCGLDADMMAYLCLVARCLGGDKGAHRGALLPAEAIANRLGISRRTALRRFESLCDLACENEWIGVTERPGKTPVVCVDVEVLPTYTRDTDGTGQTHDTDVTGNPTHDNDGTGTRDTDGTGSRASAIHEQTTPTPPERAHGDSPDVGDESTDWFNTPDLQKFILSCFQRKYDKASASDAQSIIRKMAISSVDFSDADKRSYVWENVDSLSGKGCDYAEAVNKVKRESSMKRWKKWQDEAEEPSKESTGTTGGRMSVEYDAGEIESRSVEDL